MGLESLAHAQRGFPSQSDWDKLTAMAMGSVQAEHRSARESLLNSLGVSLVAFKHARRFDLLRRAAEDLSDCLAWRLKGYRREDRRRVARLAISEWHDDNCGLCTGAGHVYDDVGVQRLCPRCSGSRKKRYSDAERAEGLEVQDGAKWAYPMDVAHAQLTLAVALAVRQAEEKLR